MLDLNIEHENHPAIRVQRRPADIEKYETTSEKFFNGRTGNGVDLVIRRGGIIGCDKDIMLLGLVTDTKAFSYVLKEDEQDVPGNLKEALRKVNRLHADFTKEFQYQRTGIEIVYATQMIPLEKGIITTTMVFHPTPMFIRKYLEGGYMFSHKTYVAGLTSTPDYYPTSIVSNSHSLHFNTLYFFDPKPTRVSVEDWGENGVDLTLGQIEAFTEEGLTYLGNPIAEWHVIR